MVPANHLLSNFVSSHHKANQYNSLHHSSCSPERTLAVKTKISPHRHKKKNTDLLLQKTILTNHKKGSRPLQILSNLLSNRKLCRTVFTPKRTWRRAFGYCQIRPESLICKSAHPGGCATQEESCKRTWTT